MATRRQSGDLLVIFHALTTNWILVDMERMGSWWQTLSCTLQKCVAANIRSAAGEPGVFPDGSEAGWPDSVTDLGSAGVEAGPPGVGRPVDAAGGAPEDLWALAPAFLAAGVERG